MLLKASGRTCSSAVLDLTLLTMLPRCRLRFRGSIEAEPLYVRSQAILDKVLGPEHPNMA